MPSIEWNQKGDFFVINGQLDQAIKCYDKAISIDPHDFEAYNEKGNVLLGLSNFSSASEAFKKFYAINNNYLKALNNNGLAYSNSYKHEEALIYYDKLISMGITQLLSSALNNKG